MVEIQSESLKASCLALTTSFGGMMSVSLYLTALERIKLQALCRRFYD